MAKRRTNITITPELYQQAQDLMSLLHYSDFAGFVEQLIREEWERREGPLKLGEHSPPVTQHPSAEHPVTYPPAPKSPRKPGKKVA